MANDINLSKEIDRKMADDIERERLIAYYKRTMIEFIKRPDVAIEAGRMMYREIESRSYGQVQRMEREKGLL